MLLVLLYVTSSITVIHNSPDSLDGYLDVAHYSINSSNIRHWPGKARDSQGKEIPIENDYVEHSGFIQYVGISCPMTVSLSHSVQAKSTLQMLNHASFRQGSRSFKGVTVIRRSQAY